MIQSLAYIMTPRVVDSYTELGDIHVNSEIIKQYLESVKHEDESRVYSDVSIEHEIKKYINNEMRILRELRKGEIR